jgi:hypothetical protein
MGERSLRRLLIIGASAVLRWAARHGAPAGSSMSRMLACKPPMLVRVGGDLGPNRRTTIT